jgi:Ca-activated chloride channel family protein
MTEVLKYTYAQKEWFWLLLLIPAITAGYIFWHNKKTFSLRYPSLQNIQASDWRFIQHVVFGINMLALAFLILAMARPQLDEEDIVRSQYTEGIDIIIALDISGSMLALDFLPNRLEVAKELAIEFIDKRPYDRIGLVVYEGEAFTLCPLTTDHNVLKKIFKDIKTGMIKDGTAIGMGLATAVNRLRETEGKSKVVILITDGVNNQGNIDPLTAAELAKEFGVRVYCIGVGSNGNAKTPIGRGPQGYIYDYRPVEIDETTMTKIAENTDGKYFRATDKEKFREIYNEIDKLEKIKVKVLEFKSDPPEKYRTFTLISLSLFMLAFLLKHLLFKQLA